MRHALEINFWDWPLVGSSPWGSPTTQTFRDALGRSWGLRWGFGTDMKAGGSSWLSVALSSLLRAFF